MKFQIKFLLCSMIVMSVSFALSGYMLISKGYMITIKQEIDNSFEKNEFVKATLQSEIASQMIQGKYNGEESIKAISIYDEYITDSDIGIMDNEGNMLIGDTTTFYNTDKIISVHDSDTNYMIYEDNNEVMLLTESTFNISSIQLHILNLKNISSIRNGVKEQILYYAVMFVVSLIIGTCIMCVISSWLTKSIKNLNATAHEIAKGKYNVRTKIHSKDEIGELSQSFDEMAEAVESRIHELKEENRKREEFVSNFTHEIKTPMTSIIGYADMIQREDIDDETRILGANYIYNEGIRLEKLSKRLLEMILVQESELKLQKIWVEELVNEINFCMKPILDNCNIKLNITGQESCIMGDFELLKTVFVNIIDNAKKASSEGDTITFEVIKNEGNIIFKVKDNGIGISKEDINKVTEAFYMVDKSRSRKLGGAGLGLSLVSKIIQLHNGVFNIESQLGRGTTVSVSFKEVIEDEYMQE